MRSWKTVLQCLGFSSDDAAAYSYGVLATAAAGLAGRLGLTDALVRAFDADADFATGVVVALVSVILNIQDLDGQLVVAAIGDRPAARAPDDDARTHAARGASALHYRAFAANPDDPGRTGSGARREDGTHNGTLNGTHAVATLPPPDAAAGLGDDAALARATRAGAGGGARRSRSHRQAPRRRVERAQGGGLGEGRRPRARSRRHA